MQAIYTCVENPTRGDPNAGILFLTRGDPMAMRGDTRRVATGEWQLTRSKPPLPDGPGSNGVSRRGRSCPSTWLDYKHHAGRTCEEQIVPQV